MTPGSNLFSSTRRFFWPALLFAFCALQTSRAQTSTPPPTAKDFMDARDAAEKARDAVLSILRQHANSRSTADDAANTIKRLSLSRDADASAIKVLSDEDTVLQSLVDGKVLDDLAHIADPTKDPLTTAKDTLTKAKQKLDGLKNNGSDFSQVLSNNQQNLVSQSSLDCQTALDQATKDDSFNKDSSKKITDALPSIVTQATEVTKKLNDALSPLTTLATVDPKTADDAKKSQILKVTGKSLPIFADIASLKGPYKNKWGQVTTKLSSLIPVSTGATPPPGGTPAPKDPVGDNFTTLDKTITAIVANLPNWLTVVQQAPGLETDKLQTFISSVDKDAAANTASATVELRAALSLRDSSKSIVDTWNKLTPIADQLGAGGTVLTSDSVSTSLAAFAKDSQALFGAISRLQEAIAGDFSEFEADQQQLFYFTDVPRLMQMLNPGAYEIGGIKGAQEQAAAQRQKLAQAELDLVAAQAEVNTYQTRLMQLPEELKQARADARKQDSVYGKTSNRLTGLTDQLSSASSAVGKQRSAPTSASAADNQKTQNDLAQAQKNKDRLTAQNADAQRDNVNALHDKDVADQKLKAAEDEQTGIPAQIEKAKLALSAAQNNVSLRRQESLLAAQSESDAFAIARDNTPYWFAPASGISKDPARRVEMYGTNDSKIIYLRGKRVDLDEVKNIIAGIDRPAPQARVTLWSLQLSYTSDKNSGQRVNQALFQVENQLAEIRTRLATSVSLLRNAVSDEVNNSVRGLCAPPASADECRMQRLNNFYNQQVLLRLGYDPQNDDYSRFITRWTVPDPVGTTTLGEALMVLSLATPEKREKVMKEFKKRIDLYDQAWANSKKQGKSREEVHVPSDFTSLTRALDLETPPMDAPKSDSKSELTSAQLEIVRALESLAYHSIVEKVISLAGSMRNAKQLLSPDCQRLASINQLLTKTQSELCSDIPPPADQQQLNCPTQDKPCLEAARKTILGRIYAVTASARTLSDRMTFLLYYLQQNYGVVFESLNALTGSFSKPDSTSKLDCAPGPDTCYQKLAARMKQALLARHPLSTATPREAAADEMLKELMTAMEEDLDRIFVRPGLFDLRAALTKQGGLQVGILQRTSVLGTNRLVARVDARSSAQLALGDQEDILQSVTQLAQVYMAAQTGGALGTLNTLNNLKSQSKEPPQEIYGITTASTFKITPIFDPSGQALRFKFDYVAANNVTEPNGTMNPQLPRIERHTVNTEVQISNMELREISRYEANSKLGLPTKFWGGIPILKDIIQEIPGARPYFPLIGWFVRKGGSAAVSQESLLFGQTIIYPSIGDIAELLTGNGNGNDLGGKNKAATPSYQEPLPSPQP